MRYEKYNRIEILMKNLNLHHKDRSKAETISEKISEDLKMIEDLLIQRYSITFSPSHSNEEYTGRQTLLQQVNSFIRKIIY